MLLPPVQIQSAKEGGKYADKYGANVHKSLHNIHRPVKMSGKIYRRKLIVFFACLFRIGNFFSMMRN
jgi:hypothetical protein